MTFPDRSLRRNHTGSKGTPLWVRTEVVWRIVKRTYSERESLFLLLTSKGRKQLKEAARLRQVEHTLCASDRYQPGVGRFPWAAGRKATVSHFMSRMRHFLQLAQRDVLSRPLAESTATSPTRTVALSPGRRSLSSAEVIRDLWQ